MEEDVEFVEKQVPRTLKWNQEKHRQTNCSESHPDFCKSSHENFKFSEIQVESNKEPIKTPDIISKKELKRRSKSRKGMKSNPNFIDLVQVSNYLMIFSKQRKILRKLEEATSLL